MNFKPTDQDPEPELEKIERDNYQTDQVFEIKPSDLLEENIIDIQESDLIYEE